MNKFDVFCNVEDSRWTAAIPNIVAVINDVKDAVIEEIQNEVEFISFDKKFTINICLSNDETVQSLNFEFRGLDKPTNVLSFANIDSDDFEDLLINDDVVEMGDVIIAFETMQRESQELNISFEHHFCHLWAHGMLHILGYDHMQEDERIEMEQIEISILNKLGIDNPYQE